MLTQCSDQCALNSAIPQVCTLELLLAFLAQRGLHQASMCVVPDAQAFLLYTNFHWIMLRQDETNGTWQLHDGAELQRVDDCAKFIREFIECSSNTVFPLR